MGDTRAAAIWDVIAGAFALRSELVIRPFSDYSGVAVGKTLPWIKPSPGFFFKFKTLPGVFPLKTTNWKNPP